MNNLTICLSDGTFDGIVHMYSRSAFSAIRIPRSEFRQYRDELSKSGLYMLLIGSDAAYVGQSGQLFERIPNPHTGNIDSKWHTLIAFPCNNRLNDNELHFLENALCEFTHKHCPHCITASPSRENCNAKYRKEHYRLLPMEINACNEYIEDIEFYISHLKDPNFSLAESRKSIDHTRPHLSVDTDRNTPLVITETPVLDSTSNIKLFSWFLKKEPTGGVAAIELFPVSDSERHIILKKGTKLSKSISAPERFNYSIEVNTLRKQFEAEGKISNYTLLQDIELPPCSSSFALGFVAGSSHSGNRDWRSVDAPHLTLGEIEQQTKHYKK